MYSFPQYIQSQHLEHFSKRLTEQLNGTSRLSLMSVAEAFCKAAGFSDQHATQSQILGTAIFPVDVSLLHQWAKKFWKTYKNDQEIIDDSYCQNTLCTVWGYKTWEHVVNSLTTNSTKLYTRRDEAQGFFPLLTTQGWLAVERHDVLVFGTQTGTLMKDMIEHCMQHEIVSVLDAGNLNINTETMFVVNDNVCLVPELNKNNVVQWVRDIVISDALYTINDHYMDAFLTTLALDWFEHWDGIHNTLGQHLKYVRSDMTQLWNKMRGETQHYLQHIGGLLDHMLFVAAPQTSIYAKVCDWGETDDEKLLHHRIVYAALPNKPIFMNNCVMGGDVRDSAAHSTQPMIHCLPDYTACKTFPHCLANKLKYIERSQTKIFLKPNQSCVINRSYVFQL